MHECNKESAKVPVRTDRQVPVELARRQRGRKYLLLLPATSGSVGHAACRREAKGYAHQSSQHSGFRPSLHECPATHRLLRCEAQVSWSPPSVPLLETGEGPPPALISRRSRPELPSLVAESALLRPDGAGRRGRVVLDGKRRETLSKRPGSVSTDSTSGRGASACAPEVRVADGGSALGDVSAARNLMKKVNRRTPP